MGRRIQNGVTTALFFVLFLLLSAIIFDVEWLASSAINKWFLITLFFVFIAILLTHILHVRTTRSLENRVEAVEGSKRDFIHMASQELQGPIAHIRGYTDLYKKGELSSEQEKYANYVETASGNLYSTISDMFDATELEGGSMKFDYADFDVEELVSEVASNHEKEADMRGVKIRKDGLKEIIIHSDREKIEKALSYIMNHAIENTKRGDVEISFGGVGDMVHVHVRDASDGLSGADKENLFEKFYRLKSLEDEEVRSSGLGLWLSREIILKLKGNIEVESIKGVGTHFIVKLPIVRK